MKNFLDDDFILKNETAKSLYFDVAQKLPIIDYHCHLSPQEIATDKHFADITEIWLGGDHYKWRLMRSCGIKEELITGKAGSLEKFTAFATALSNAPGHPVYHWSHLELQRYFGFFEPLTKENAKQCYEHCNEKLQNLSAKTLITNSKVEVICTTDDPDDSLSFHKEIANSGFATKVLPTFRPDRLLKNEQNLSKIELLKHLESRLDYFAAHGCKLSDHAITHFNDNTEIYFELAKLYKQAGVTMQLHFGCIRNVRPAEFAHKGPDIGYDIIADYSCAEGLSSLLGRCDAGECLPNTILYSLNPTDNAVLSCMAAAFGSSVRHGTAWWFNDHKQGMSEQLSTLASQSPLGTFLGMLTDSRSFLSYTRHEYFRRILCSYLGDLVENGEFPNSKPILTELVENISYNNCKNFIQL